MGLKTGATLRAICRYHSDIHHADLLFIALFG